jgi:transposase
MAATLLPNPLWDLVEPFLPIPPRRPHGGRPRVADRACLTGIVFVLRSGIPWQMLPQELGCGSGMTCWRRLRDWQQAGVWDLIHFALLDWLARSDQIDWSRAVLDSCSIRAVYGGDETGPSPTDRAKRGSKRHLICDGRGVPLAVRCALPARTGTTRKKRCRSWMRFHRCKDAGARGTGPTACLVIAATTRQEFGAGCGRGISSRGSPCVVPRTGAVWAGGDGSWSGPLRGSTNFAVRACGMTSERTSMRPFSRLDAR